MRFGGRGRAFQWAVLFALSAVLAGAMELAAMPAALLLGPMIAGIFVGTRGGSIKVPRPIYYFAQAVISLLIARAITTDMLGTVTDNWVSFAAVLTGVLAASGGLGFLLMRWQVFPGTTAIWSCWPGAASAMVLMAESYGADGRLVAFAQYLRVAMVVAAAALVALLITDAGGASRPEIVWFPPVDWIALAATLALALAGTLAGVAHVVPAGAFVLTLVGGAVLHATGLMEIELPPWLLAASYALVGWNIGLGFTQKILAHAWRALPRVFGAILVLIVICGFYAYLLHRFAGVDPLTAYLAASPGGADSVAIIAASTPVDVPFVIAMQTLRFFVVLLIGPYLARLLARRQPPPTPPPPAPLD